MKQFTYIINDSLGTHACPAGLLARAYTDAIITVTTDGNIVKARQMIGLTVR